MPPSDVQLEKLVEVDQLRRQVASTQVVPSDGLEQLESIASRPSRYNGVTMTLAMGASSATAACFFGGGFAEFFVAFLLGGLTSLLGLATAKVTALQRLFEPLAAALASFVSVMISTLLFPIASEVTTLSGLIILIPGLTLTIALTELATRHLTSGTTRLMNAATLFLGIAFGVAFGIKAAELLLEHLWATQPVAISPTRVPWWFLSLALLVAPIGFGVLFRAGPRDFPWIFLAGIAAFVGARLGSLITRPTARRRRRHVLSGCRSSLGRTPPRPTRRGNHGTGPDSSRARKSRLLQPARYDGERHRHRPGDRLRRSLGGKSLWSSACCSPVWSCPHPAVKNREAHSTAESIRVGEAEQSRQERRRKWQVATKRWTLSASTHAPYRRRVDGESCNKIAFKARGKAFLYLGITPDGFNTMLKLKDNLSEASKLEKKSPKMYSVGSSGWVKGNLQPQGQAIAPPPEALDHRELSAPSPEGAGCGNGRREEDEEKDDGEEEGCEEVKDVGEEEGEPEEDREEEAVRRGDETFNVQRSTFNVQRLAAKVLNKGTKRRARHHFTDSVTSASCEPEELK